MQPLALGAGLDRDHVQVREQDDRTPRPIRAFPAIEQAVAAHDLADQRPRHGGVRRLQISCQLQKGRGIEPAGLLVRHGPVGDRLREALGRGGAIDPDAGGGRDAHLSGCESGGPNRENRAEHREPQRRQRQDPLHARVRWCVMVRNIPPGGGAASPVVETRGRRGP